MSLTRDSLIVLIKQEVKGLSSYLVDDDYSNAVDDALRETGWTLPVGTSFREYWIKDRSKRHIFFYLLSESAHKFKVKQINLQHRFEHYKYAVQVMDDNYDKIQDERPEEFSTSNVVNMFGHKVDAGFSYQSETGIETTYDDDQIVIISPNE